MGDDLRQLPDYVQTVVVKDSKGLEKILLLPKALDLDRPKRTRTAFSKWQLDILEKTFELNPYLVGEQRTTLAKRLALSETQIKVWYQNRRTKQRKECPKDGVESNDKQQLNLLPNANSEVDEWNQKPENSSSAPFYATQIFQHFAPSSQDGSEQIQKVQNNTVDCERQGMESQIMSMKASQCISSFHENYLRIQSCKRRPM